jgi:hypothetical protein
MARPRQSRRIKDGPALVLKSSLFPQLDADAHRRAAVQTQGGLGRTTVSWVVEGCAEGADGPWVEIDRRWRHRGLYDQAPPRSGPRSPYGQV